MERASPPGRKKAFMPDWNMQLARNILYHEFIEFLTRSEKNEYFQTMAPLATNKRQKRKRNDG